MSILEQKLKDIYGSTILSKSEKISRSESILLKLVEEEPSNTDIYFKLAVIVLEEPEEDFVTSIEYIKKILSINEDSADAALFLSWVQYYHRGYTDLDTIDLLDRLIDNIEIDSITKSLCYLAKSWSYEISDSQKLFLLKKSVDTDSSYVSNLLAISNHYRSHGDTRLEKEAIISALRNIESIICIESSPITLQDFEPYKGQNFNGIEQSIVTEVPDYNRFKDEYLLETKIDSYRLNTILVHLKTL